MNRPKLTREELLEKLSKFDTSFEDYPLLIVGIRGYYLNSLGEKGKNDRGIYDDAIFILSRNIFSAFNGNTDPSIFRDNIAVLRPGFYPVYKFDFHRGKKTYPAICQRLGNVIVDRDGGRQNHSGSFGINIHNGGWGTTGSLGCQTLHPSQWEEFYNTAEAEAIRLWGNRWNEEKVAYILIENKL